MRCLETFSERIAAGNPDRQTAGIRIRIALMTRFSAQATAEIVRAAVHRRGKGASCNRPEFRDNALVNGYSIPIA